MDEDIGFKVLEAETGEEAIQTVWDEKIDLILLDNKLPGISGLEVLEEVKKSFPGVRVMMITSFASQDVAVKATKNGAYDFVPKPFTPQELKASVETLVKKMFLNKMSSGQ